MKNTRNMMIAGLAASMLLACEGTEPTVDPTESKTDTFRQALPSEDDVQMQYGSDGTATQALNGEYALLAGMTAEAVVGTNAFMIGHFALLHAISKHQPTEEGEDYRVWQGEHNDLTLRVRAEASDTPRGTRYDYTFAGKYTADEGDFLPIVDGHVVRFRDEFEPKDGFGIVRFHFGNLNVLEPEREIDGIVRVAFRKADRAHQVHVRAIGVKTPDDPYFPRAAEYRYAVTQDGAGGLQWFARGDVKKDGEPYENVAIHTAWRKDKSGVGSGFVTGGSLEVDYWHLLECWDSTFIKGFDMLSLPGFDMPSGDPATCFATPEDLEVPEMAEELPDEDPEIPAPLDGEEDDAGTDEDN